MKKYLVTFKSNNASSLFTMFESKDLKEALDFFNSSNFDSFFDDELNAVEDSSDCSEIELRKLICNEISEFEQNEQGLKINKGWLIKKYSKL
jgi:hypothetical protein